MLVLEECTCDGFHGRAEIVGIDYEIVHIHTLKKSFAFSRNPTPDFEEELAIDSDRVVSELFLLAAAYHLCNLCVVA